MIASTFIFIVKIVAVVAMLAAMVMLLVGIRRVASGSPETEDAETLRKEVADEDAVISSHSLFRQFIDPDRRR